MRNTLLATAHVAMMVVVCARPAYAQSPEDEDYPPSVKLGTLVCDLKVGPQMNAAGRPLRGSVFVSQDLKDAVFTGSDLSDVAFIKCDLSNASFKGAVFGETKIEMCDLTNADCDDAIINGLTTSGKHLSDKQFQSTRSYRTKDLKRCLIVASKWDGAKPLVKYDFRGAELTDAFLLEGDFGDCDFTDARIDGLSIVGARITFKQLASTSNYKKWRGQYLIFPKISLYNRVPFAVPEHQSVIDGTVDFRGINLAGLSINGKPLPGADFTDAIITDGFFTGGITRSQLVVTKNYKDGSLTRITFWDIDLSACDLSRQNLTACEFGSCDFTGAILRDAVITGADFNSLSGGHRGLTVEQIKSTWNYKNGRMAGVVLPKDIADALLKEKEAEKEARK